MTIDWNKPFTTLSGVKARLVGKIKHPYAPMIVATNIGGGVETVFQYRESGEVFPMSNAMLNLKNTLTIIKPSHIYKTRSGKLATTQFSATHHGTIHFFVEGEHGKTFACFTGDDNSYGAMAAGKVHSNLESPFDLIDEVRPIFD